MPAPGALLGGRGDVAPGQRSAAGRASALTQPSGGPRDPSERGGWGGPPEKFLGKNTLGPLRGGSEFHSCPRPSSAPPRPPPRPASPLAAPSQGPVRGADPGSGERAWGEGNGDGGEEVGALPSGTEEEEGE